MVGRRVFIKTIAASAFASSADNWNWLARRRVSAVSSKTEEQSGDPDLPVEILSYDRTKLDEVLVRTDKILGVRKNPQKFASQMLKVAVAYRGISRDKNPNKVEQFLSLFPINPRDEMGKLLPFCAAGVSFSACQAYCDLSPSRIDYETDPSGTLKGVLPDIAEFYFKPHCSCQEIVEDARKRRIWSPNGVVPPPGWLVFYDWKQHGVASHVGIIERADKTGIHAIEFNTTDEESGDQGNGGSVARRSRTYDYVLGFVRTYQV